MGYSFFADLSLVRITKFTPELRDAAQKPQHTKLLSADREGLMSEAQGGAGGGVPQQATLWKLEEAYAQYHATFMKQGQDAAGVFSSTLPVPIQRDLLHTVNTSMTIRGLFIAEAQSNGILLTLNSWWW